MVHKYNCNLCNFHTNHKGNSAKHHTTKKHILLKKQIIDSKNGIVDSKNGIAYSKNGIVNMKKKTIKYDCKFCTKKYSTKTNLNKHIKKCKKGEIQKILDDKNKLEKKLKELVIDYEEIKIENEELEKEYNDFLKKTANNFVDNKTTNITNNTLNMHYVINNFTDAPNFADQITEQLTDSEKENIIKCGPVTGCVKLINMKCVEDKKANERSIHCLDPSRKKFIIRVDDNWQIDLKGKKMLTISIPITKDIFEKDFDFDNINDPFLKSEIINKLIQLEHKAGHIKIMNDLTGTTLLKNNQT